jgi:predicted dehydrogenase
MSDSPVRLALIGHPDDIDVWAAVAPRVIGVEISVVADSMESALGESDSDFDAVTVTSYAEAHVAVAAGKHALVDAPVAESLNQIEMLLKVCRQTGVEIGVGRSSFRSPGNRIILDRLKTGKLGAPGLLRVHRWDSAERTLAELAYGDINFALEVFGATPKEIYGLDRGDGSYRQIHLGFSNGGMAVLDYATRLPDGQSYDSLSLIGSSGAAYADDHHNTHLLLTGRSTKALISHSGSGSLEELQVFVDDVASAAGDSASVFRVHRVIESIRQSMEAGQVLVERGDAYVPA